MNLGNKESPQTNDLRGILLNRKEFPEALPRGFPLKMSTPNLFRGLNIKFRILIPKGQNETSKIPLWRCLGDSSFQEIFYWSSSTITVSSLKVSGFAIILLSIPSTKYVGVEVI